MKPEFTGRDATRTRILVTEAEEGEGVDESPYNTGTRSYMIRNWQNGLPIK